MATAAERLALLEAAEKEILEGGQVVDILGEKYERADLKQIQSEIARLRSLSAASAGTGTPSKTRNVARFTNPRK